MASGVLIPSRPANRAQRVAAALADSGCTTCPPSPTNGGVTGSQPATGPSPTGQQPSARQRMLRNPTPAGQIARQTGNNPCGGNDNSSSNIANQGYTSNPNVIPVAASRLGAQPVSPYAPNPTSEPTSAPGGQPATDGNGFPTDASQTGCGPCGGGGASSDYDNGFNAGMQDAAAEAQGQEGGHAATAAMNANPPADMGAFNQGYNDAFRPSLIGRRRPLRDYNTRRGIGLINVRRGIRRYFA